MATNVNELIFIKRVKKRGHEASQGGAWKIAYADFVTAMMAFFSSDVAAQRHHGRPADSHFQLLRPGQCERIHEWLRRCHGGVARSIAKARCLPSTSRPNLMLGVRKPGRSKARLKTAEKAPGAMPLTRATPMIPATPREVVRNAKRSVSPKPRKCSRNSSSRTRNSARSKIICASRKLALACASKFLIISKLRCSRLVAQR